MSTTSVARAGVEFGGLGGLHTFSEKSDLGVVKMGGEPVPAATSLKNSALFGFRLGFYFTDKLGVEGEAGAIPTEPRSILFDVWMIAARAQVVYQLRSERPGKVLIPFALAGAGMTQIVDVGEAQNESIVKKDLKVAPYLGIGAKYRTGGGWGVRADARLSLTGKSPNASGVALEAEALLAIYKEFGRPAVKKKEEAPPPPTEDADPDKDGLVGAADKCPTEAEDKDSFEDDNGCPDPDNDADGVLDAAPDKCPAEAEDKDGFQDEDGCPDTDNDNDGVLDAADKCGDQAETKNGFQDADGCADDLPEPLKKATGVQPVNFKVNAADLAFGANKPLDALVVVLKEHADVKLEIGVHTDDLALRAGGKFADNTALSQARADAVKAYLVSKGIDEARLTAKGYADTVPVEAPTGLTGAKLAAARAKNRRVELKLATPEAPPAGSEPPSKQ